MQEEVNRESGNLMEILLEAGIAMEVSMNRHPNEEHHKYAGLVMEVKPHTVHPTVEYGGGKYALVYNWAGKEDVPDTVIETYALRKALYHFPNDGEVILVLLVGERTAPSGKKLRGYPILVHISELSFPQGLDTREALSIVSDVYDLFAETVYSCDEEKRRKCGKSYVGCIDSKMKEANVNLDRIRTVLQNGGV